MTTMLERAARAMEDRLYQMEQGEDGPDCYRRLGRSEYAELTRAVLMAVRDGSPEIFSAMDRAQPLWPSSQCDNRLELERSANGPKVRAMIDAILNDGSAK